MRGGCDLNGLVPTARKRADSCRNRLQWAHQRCAGTSWNDLDYSASLTELSTAAAACRKTVYDLLAITWALSEAAPVDPLFGYRRPAIDASQLTPSDVHRLLGELDHLLRDFDMFGGDGVERLLGDLDYLFCQFDQLCVATSSGLPPRPVGGYPQ
jgi:hypothetical protein